MRHHPHHLFFAAAPTGDTITLGKQEAHHAVSVLRAHVGDILSVTDGNGCTYSCAIEKIDRTACVTRIVDTRKAAPPPTRLHLFVGLPDREAFEAVLDGAVPLGVSSITPIVCRHCQTQWWKGKWEKRETRFRRIMIAGVKQSLSPFLPVLEAVRPFDGALRSASGTVVYADSNGTAAMDIASRLSASDSVSCFVGPPGGFAPDEIEALRGRGACALWLAANRLRTELASMAITAAVLQAIGQTS